MFPDFTFFFLFSYFCLHIPEVGFNEEIPQKWAGILKLPPTSEPRPKIDPPIDIKHASPPDEPPGVRVLSNGCVVSPNTGFEQAYVFMVWGTLVRQNGIAPKSLILWKEIKFNPHYTMCDFHDFGLTFFLHNVSCSLFKMSKNVFWVVARLPQRLKSTFFEIFSSLRWALRDRSIRKFFKKCWF